MRQLWQSVQAPAVAAQARALRVRQGGSVRLSTVPLPRQTEEQPNLTHVAQTRIVHDGADLAVTSRL